MGNFNRGNRSDRGRDGKRSNRKSFGSRGSDRPEMHDAVCAECGNTCQVPFRPTSNKPVYCDDCFGSHKNRDAGRGSIIKQDIRIDDFKQKFEDLNTKLDKIIELLSSSSPIISVKETAKKAVTKDIVAVKRPVKTKKTVGKTKVKKPAKKTK
ncbi:MAG: CxxC-x17-CxxC domain-containing protein [Patescibacteria group bacterium]